MNPQEPNKAEPKKETNNLPRELKEVRDNEEASLPDQTYTFDESNTDDEEYHDVDDDFLEDINYEE